MNNEEITHEINKLMSSLAGIIESNIHDSGQIHIAEMKLEEILNLFQKVETQVREEAIREAKLKLANFIPQPPTLENYLTVVKTGNMDAMYDYGVNQAKSQILAALTPQKNT